MKKLVASCSISERPNNRNPNFPYRKKIMNNYASHFLVYQCITSVPRNHGSPSESYLSEDSKLDSTPDQVITFIIRRQNKSSKSFIS